MFKKIFWRHSSIKSKKTKIIKSKFRQSTRFKNSKVSNAGAIKGLKVFNTNKGVKVFNSNNGGTTTIV